MRESFARYIDRWLPRTRSEDELTSARFLVRAWIVALPALVVSEVVYLLAGSWGQAALTANLFVAGLVALGWVRRGGRVSVITHFSLAAATIAFGGSTLAETPPDITNAAFLGILPLGATLLLDRRGARIWVVVPLLAAVAMLILADLGMTLAISDPTPLLSHATNVSLLILVVWAFARSFASVREDALRSAREADRAKSAFLATVSHEIRTPMNAILGMTELVLGDELTATQRERLEVVQRSGGLLVSLVNDILDAMKIEAGKLVLESVAFDVRRVVRDVAALHHGTARARGIGLDVVLDSALPELVAGDPLRLTQILGNLTSNAVKFTERGRVTLRVDHVAPGRARFSVEDTGPGIAPDVLPTLFTRFQQAASWTTRRHGGTGLGLALAKELVELMGGTGIEVVSDVGRGTRMSFEIPLPKAIEPLRRITGEVVPPPTNLRVLVVDDNPLNLAVVRGLLEHAGCHVDLADSGRAALERAAAARYALVFMDLYMPDMDGLEATRRLRAEGSPAVGTPIVGLTASALPEELAACREAGMIDVLVKPIEARRLRSALEHARRDVSADGRARPEPASDR